MKLRLRRADIPSEPPKQHRMGRGIRRPDTLFSSAQLPPEAQPALPLRRPPSSLPRPATANPLDIRPYGGELRPLRGAGTPPDGLLLPPDRCPSAAACEQLPAWPPLNGPAEGGLRRVRAEAPSRACIMSTLLVDWTASPSLPSTYSSSSRPPSAYEMNRQRCRGTSESLTLPPLYPS